MKSFLKNLLALTGLASIITMLGSLAYVDKKLHDVSNGYKYGPARHLEYLSALLHSFNRSMMSLPPTRIGRCATRRIVSMTVWRMSGRGLGTRLADVG